MADVRIISLKDEKSKELARTLSNETAQNILQKLTELKPVKRIADELNLPMTTVQSSIQKLEEVGLVEQTHYKWSPKGRKQRLYQPAKNIIIFAPEKAHASIIEALKNNLVLPAVLAIAGGAGVVSRLFKPSFARGAGAVAEDVMLTAPEKGASVALAAPPESNLLLIISIMLLVVGLVWIAYIRLQNHPK